ncbi:MAG: sulfite exporter TauE/SafE family protein [Planctomycetes bacterium]|nr:sulfite exporter TauE/SafE family protein [Planctomycetota bacterium]
MDITAVSLTYLPIAVGLGALHALEPGHAKTMTAAYLVGIHGRWTDAVLLGLAAALTHSLVVIAIAVTALYLGREAFAGDAIWWLQIGSGVVVILLGSWMLWRRLRPRAHVHHHHDAAAPVVASGPQHRCEVGITGAFPNERMILLFATAPSGAVTAAISRPGGKTERLSFAADAAQPLRFVSAETPQEPHEFSAVIELADGERLPFAVTEPVGHGHDHLDDVAHAKAHADQMPAYVGTGLRPTWWQVVVFGAAGGLVPCPASISVMLLALSVGSTVSGLVLVFGFSLGLALALVGVGLVVVAGMHQLGKSGRFSALSRYAPAISAAVVVASGLAAVVLGLIGPGHHPAG